ncbi:MAG TPA: tetratricopeptide repeat protein [Dissulfurispiraceae bacterium]|nr:tetratricopeptide repeat protein [Dissulfurispiraceae bacterium]
MTRALKVALIGVLLVVMLAALSGCGLSAGQDAFDKGMAYFSQGNYEQAIPHFQRAIDLDPEFVDAYIYLGRSQLNMKHWRESIAPLRTAYRLAPDRTKGVVQDLIMDAILGAATQGLKLDK